ncbi:MAG: PepSY domain-containing protein [Solibacillus sp.]|uniref:PepSY domain-containing protein n=1 Tax=Solibacillus sp. TaxID=1909654 RepID=UPI00331581EC
MKKFLLTTAAVFTLSSFSFVQADITEAAPQTKYISKAKAQELALKIVSGKVVDIEFDLDDRTPHYEIEIKNSKKEVDLEVNAVTGKVTVTDREPIQKQKAAKTTKLITKEKAIELAKAKLNGKGKVTDIELEHEDHVRYYEMELTHGKTEYDVKIHAVTGKILKFERD